MTSCRVCEQEYTPTYTRTARLCNACASMPEDEVMQRLAKEVETLKHAEGALMSLVYETPDWERWSKVIDAYHEANRTPYPAHRRNAQKEYRERIVQTIRKGGLFGELVAAWWRRVNRQNDFLALDWELFNDALARGKDHAV